MVEGARRPHDVRGIGALTGALPLGAGNLFVLIAAAWTTRRQRTTVDLIIART